MGSLDVIRLKQLFSVWLPAKKKHLGVRGDTSGVSVKSTPMFKSVMAFPTGPGIRVTLIVLRVVPTSRHASGFGQTTKADVKTGSRTGTVAGGAGWWVCCAVPWYCCQPVQNGMVRTVRGRQHRLGSSCGWGSVTLTSTTGPDGDLLGIHEGEPA
ncbi:hypothetical protein TIFTF001_011130 [Ficus carica]|uniref:Uncharacterized protein n=1 Tax=Ficus carica TaxID=3494 RepID=A0AA87ZR43_FICCA|nr:hypothetical protein TIFTF001_011130 [Ficus carica]